MIWRGTEGLTLEKLRMNARDVELCLLEAMPVGVTSNYNRNVKLPITQGLKANRDEKGPWLLQVAMMGLPRAKLEFHNHGEVLSEAKASSDLFLWSRGKFLSSLSFFHTTGCGHRPGIINLCLTSLS